MENKHIIYNHGNFIHCNDQHFQLENHCRNSDHLFSHIATVHKINAPGQFVRQRIPCKIMGYIDTRVWVGYYSKYDIATLMREFFQKGLNSLFDVFVEPIINLLVFLILMYVCQHLR